MKFVLPMKVSGEYGLNRTYTGKHWAIRSRQAREIHALVHYAMIQQKIEKKLQEKAVVITLRYNSRMDCDNHGYLTKLIIDALKGYLIVDDSRRYVREIRQCFWNGDGVEVQIEPYIEKQEA